MNASSMNCMNSTDFSWMYEWHVVLSKYCCGRVANEFFSSPDQIFIAITHYYIH